MSETNDVLRSLSLPANSDDHVSRRRFLQGTLASGGLAAAGSSILFSNAADAAPPLGATEGVLVLVYMAGGNDSLSTVVPMNDATYHALRPRTRITNALPITGGLGFHPNLPRLRDRFNQGKVAVVQGVGQTDADDLSHFSSMATWMRGAGGPVAGGTGWVGRYLDGLGGARTGFEGMQIGSSIPLHMVGSVAPVTALTANDSDLFGARDDSWERALQDAVTSYGGSTGLGTWGDELAATGGTGIGAARTMAPLLAGTFPEGELATELTLAARVINADLGARVISVSFGDFDTHDDQPGEHDQRMAEFDTAVDSFFSELQGRFHDRVTVMTFSEFGRRGRENDSRGTDHGNGGSMMLIGDNVAGGLHGAHPSLTDLDQRGNLKTSLDFRQVYGTVLDRWLNADHSQVLGRSYGLLPLFTSTPGGCTAIPPSQVMIAAAKPTANSGYWMLGQNAQVHAFGAGSVYGGSCAQNWNAADIEPRTAGDGYWILSAEGNVYSFGAAGYFGGTGSLPAGERAQSISATPSQAGYWICTNRGRVLSFGNAGHFGDMAGIPLQGEVIDSIATPTGLGYYMVAEDGGVFSFGDAHFYGSMGGVRLNGRVLGLAPTPDNKGYWLVAQDGGIFAFGTATFRGSMGSTRLNRPVRGMVAFGKGYLLVAEDGGIFNFSDLEFHGSLGASPPPYPIVSVAGFEK
ncbi:MAG: DUF1501 domain-containing protein [Actinomycetia bacterium]|nr:DUF1501 domain-containing protein [Actinomycetes bacterium]